MKNRVLQYFLIIAILSAIAGGWFYYKGKAAETLRDSLIANLPAEQTKTINASQVNKLTDGLVGYWTMDGANTNWTSSTAGTVADSSGNGNTGTLTNMSQSTSPAIGKIGQGLNFNGTNQYVNLGDQAAFDFGLGNFTLSMWVNSNQGGRMIIGKDDWNTASDNGILMYQASSKDVTYWNGTVDITSSANLGGRWNYVSVVREGTGANQLKFYYNGNLVLTNSDSRNLNNSRSLIIGSDSGFNNFFNGKLDELRIYDRALSASEITELYQQGQTKINASQVNKLTDGLVGYWTMDGPDINWGANTITNRGTLGGTGTLTNMSQATDPKIGKIGQALNFDGTNNYINNGDILGFDVDDAFSVSFWVKPVVVSSSGYVIAKWYAGSFNGWYLQFNSNKLYFYARDENDNMINVHHSDTPVLNVWQHYTMTYDGSNNATGVKIYRDGVANQTVVLNTAPVSLLNSDPLTIGVRSSFSGPLNGSLDEVRVYSRALSASEVTELYNQGR